MNPEDEFTWQQAQQTVESLIWQQTQKHLSDIEIVILQGAWEQKTYEEIAEAQGYTSSYLSKDVGNKLWNNLSLALKEKVSKKNFKAALERKWRLAKGYATRSQNQSPQVRVPRSNETTTDNLFPEGSVALDSPFYIERSHGLAPQSHLEFCDETIAKPGALIRIKGAKWMGKTSLVNRVLQQAGVAGQIVYLDFGSVERTIVQDLDKLLRWLCVMVCRQLKLANQVKDYWDTDILGSNDNCTVYFEEYILTETDSEVVLALDNIDRLFAYEGVIEDFFGMLRSWHEKGKIDSRWARLKLILSHSTEVYVPLDINQSPFNTGVPILLEEFTNKEVATLAGLYQLDWQQSQVTQLMNLVGGHPYLVRLAMYQIKTSNLPLSQFIGQTLWETGIYGNPLRRLRNVLQQASNLCVAYRKVVDSDTPVALDAADIYQLHSIGLVKYQQNLVVPRCKLYRDYFQQIFAENQPT